MFASTLDLIPNGVLIINMQTRAISFVNKEMEEIVGIDRSSSSSEEDRFELIKEKVCQYFQSDSWHEKQEA